MSRVRRAIYILVYRNKEYTDFSREFKRFSTTPLSRQEAWTPIAGARGGAQLACPFAGLDERAFLELAGFRFIGAETRRSNSRSWAQAGYWTGGAGGRGCADPLGGC